MRRAVILLIMMGCLCPGLALGITRHVDKNGTCGQSGSVTTLQAAVNASANGDVIRVCQSTTPYNEFVNVTANAGTGANRRTIENFPGHTPVFSYSGGANPLANIALDGDNWTMRGLTFQGDAGFSTIRAILVRGLNVIVENNTITGWGGDNMSLNNNGSRASHPLNVSGGGGDQCPPGFLNFIIRNNIMTNNRLNNIMLTCVDTGLVEGNEISGTKCARDTDGAVNENGIKFTQGGTNVTIRGNQIHDWTPHSTCTLTSQGFSTFIGIWIDEDVLNGVIEDNKIWNIDQNKKNFSNPNGSDNQSVGIMIERDCYGWTIRNNLVSNIGTQGLRQAAVTDAGGSITRWYNNTISNIGFYGMWIRSGTDIELRNNLFYNSGVANLRVESFAGPTEVTANHNLYWDTAGGNKVGQWLTGGVVGMTAWRSASGQDANAVNSNPQLVDATNRDFRLCTGSGTPGGCVGASPAINAGANLSPTVTDDIIGTARPQNGIYDIGAYEAGGAPTVPAAPTNLRIVSP